MILNRAVDFIVTSDQVPSVGELQLAKRLFSILLLGMSSPQNKPLHNWMQNTWFLKTPVLKKNTAKIMVWLLSPHQSNATRVYAVHSLMEEPITQAILSSLLEVHPQVKKKNAEGKHFTFLINSEFKFFNLDRAEIHSVLLGFTAKEGRNAQC